MTAGSRARPALAATAAVVLAAAIGAVGIASPASATDIDLAFDFGQVLPGDVIEQREAFDVPFDATVASVAIGAPIDPEFGTVVASACAPAVGCIPVSALSGRDLPHGEYELVVVLTVSDELESGSVAAVGGRITLVERSQGLAGTGSAIPVLGLVTASALALAGLILAGLARRRRAEKAS